MPLQPVQGFARGRRVAAGGAAPGGPTDPELRSSKVRSSYIATSCPCTLALLQSLEPIGNCLTLPVCLPAMRACTHAYPAPAPLSSSQVEASSDRADGGGGGCADCLFSFTVELKTKVGEPVGHHAVCGTLPTKTGRQGRRQDTAGHGQSGRAGQQAGWRLALPHNGSLIAGPPLRLPAALPCRCSRKWTSCWWRTSGCWRASVPHSWRRWQLRGASWTSRMHAEMPSMPLQAPRPLTQSLSPARR